jgi:hypothetical protein
MNGGLRPTVAVGLQDPNVGNGDEVSGECRAREGSLCSDRDH